MSVSNTSMSSLEAALTGAVRDMVLRSPRLTELAGGAAAVQSMLDSIENVWLDYGGSRVHCDLHRSPAPKATIVFQPGSGAHARLYFLLGGLLARAGYHLLAIDRPGHGLSDGRRGDCTVEEAIGVSAAALEWARAQFSLPVVLMGSSMGGLLTVFALLEGLDPELAIAHNFVFPGKLFSLRLRARWIARYRTNPYPLTELVHGLERLSTDAAVTHYLQSRSDPGMAWELSARSVASLFAYSAKASPRAPQTLVLTGARDTAIPAWATRFFMWWSGLPRYDLLVIPGAGHLFFHDHLSASVPAVTKWLEAHLAALPKDDAGDDGFPTRRDKVKGERQRT